jgi:hypothetical protein
MREDATMTWMTMTMIKWRIKRAARGSRPLPPRPYVYIAGRRKNKLERERKLMALLMGIRSMTLRSIQRNVSGNQLLWKKKSAFDSRPRYWILLAFPRVD